MKQADRYWRLIERSSVHQQLQEPELRHPEVVFAQVVPRNRDFSEEIFEETAIHLVPSDQSDNEASSSKFMDSNDDFFVDKYDSADSCDYFLPEDDDFAPTWQLAVIPFKGGMSKKKKRKVSSLTSTQSKMKARASGGHKGHLLLQQSQSEPTTTQLSEGPVKHKRSKLRKALYVDKYEEDNVNECAVEELDEDIDLEAAAARLKVIVPLSLQPSIDPRPSDAATCVLVDIDDAFFQAHQDFCFNCGSGSDWGDMVFCVDCGEAFHSYCANLPKSLLITMQEPGYAYNWRCINCKICEVCGHNETQKQDEDMIFCEVCDHTYHFSCLSPALDASQVNAETSWFCPECVHCSFCSHTNPLKLWGFASDRCIDCQYVTAITKCRDCDGVIKIDDDETSCSSDSCFTCEDCGGRMHVDCFLRSECSLLVRTGRAAIRCGGCQKLPAKATSSLALRRVQMLQLELQERKRLADAAAVEGALDSKVKDNKLYVIAMTVWATIRIMLLNRGVGALQGAHLDAYMQFYRSTASFPPQNASKLLLNIRTPSSQAASFVYASDLMLRNDIRRLSEALIVL
eukprot:gene40101-48868_t